MAASCDPEEVCAMELDTEEGTLRTVYSLDLDVLLVVGGSAPVGSSSSSGKGGADSEHEFEASVALWLGVDKGTISVSYWRSKCGHFVLSLFVAFVPIGPINVRSSCCCLDHMN